MGIPTGKDISQEDLSQEPKNHAHTFCNPLDDTPARHKVSLSSNCRSYPLVSLAIDLRIRYYIQYAS